MSRRAAATFPLLGILALLVGLPFAWRFVRPLAPAPAPTVAPPVSLLVPTPTDTAGVEVALLRAGISPKALAAVGAPSSMAGTIVSNARDYLVANPTALSSADTAYATAKRESDRLKRLIESGRGSPEDVQSYQTQTAALATATAQQASALGALFTAAAEPLSASQRQLLQRIQASATWELPIEFSVVNRTEAQWVELRSALANERFSAEYHETADAAAVSVLAAARADASVAAASSSLDASLASITSAWNTATSD